MQKKGMDFQSPLFCIYVSPTEENQVLPVEDDHSLAAANSDNNCAELELLLDKYYSILQNVTSLPPLEIIIILFL